MKAYMGTSSLVRTAALLPPLVGFTKTKNAYFGLAIMSV